MHESEIEKEKINLKHFIEEAKKLLLTKVSRADSLALKDESA
jgi:hypothetical protein